MVRVTSAVPSRRKKNRRFKLAKGYWGGRKRLWRTVSETLVRAWAFATAHRRLKKRDFRALWIQRINAATRLHGMSYSVFMHGLKEKNINLDRKALAEIAYSDADGFKAIVEKLK